ncbi:MAG TPA: UDP-N-acetylglucosamine 2-epimerase [Mucilaginibacter sp.]
MRIGVLTSSRADFGIYLPLLKRLKADDAFALEIIAFGTHLSPYHGYTIDQIEAAGFEVKYKIESMLQADSSAAIATAMGLTTIKFADFWRDHTDDFDLVFCLGDRYEMFSAVMAGVPFQIPFAHLHGGETTLGAIDNVFRHSIALAAKYHFTATEDAAERVKQLTDGNYNVHYVGALSLDNLKDIELLSIEEFKQQWGIDLSKKTILTTFHPETVDYESNERYAGELVKTIQSLNGYQVLITMPNADTAGSIIRKALTVAFKNSDRVFLVENLGPKGYFSAMKHCTFLLGNTSSGIIEAASFGKYVINLGDRQKGRSAGSNVIHTSINANEIINAVHGVESSDAIGNRNIYFNGGATERIIAVLKELK